VRKSTIVIFKARRIHRAGCEGCTLETRHNQRAYLQIVLEFNSILSSSIFRKKLLSHIISKHLEANKTERKGELEMALPGLYGKLAGHPYEGQILIYRQAKSVFRYLFTRDGGNGFYLSF
jgi:hypothetical protein